MLRAPNRHAQVFDPVQQIRQWEHRIASEEKFYAKLNEAAATSGKPAPEEVPTLPLRGSHKPPTHGRHARGVDLPSSSPTTARSTRSTFSVASKASTGTSFSSFSGTSISSTSSQFTRVAMARLERLERSLEEEKRRREHAETALEKLKAAVDSKLTTVEETVKDSGVPLASSRSPRSVRSTRSKPASTARSRPSLRSSTSRSRLSTARSVLSNAPGARSARTPAVPTLSLNKHTK